MSRLLQRLVDGRSLSELDAERLAALPTSESQANLSSEGAALQWLAKEYGLEFTSLEAIEIEQDVISLFPARILIKEKLLPLRQSAEGVEVATSRLFDPQGLESLKVLSGLSITPVLATSEAIQREIKSRLMQRESIPTHPRLSATSFKPASQPDANRMSRLRWHRTCGLRVDA